MATARPDMDGTRSPAQVHQAATAEVTRAARLLDLGLSSFAITASDADAAAGSQGPPPLTERRPAK